MKEKTLIDGMYLAEHNNSMFDRYKIIVRVTECEKSYKLELIKCESRYSPAHIDALFEKSKIVVISKKSVKHVIRLWSNDSFTLYPFKSGIPFYFRLMEENTAIKSAKGKKENTEKCVLCGGQVDELYAERIWELAGIICEDVLDDKEHENQDLIFNAIRTYSRCESQQTFCGDENNKNFDNGGKV